MSISIAKNAAFNYLGQFYLIGIVLIANPFYFKYLGAESYGLFGFFVLAQNWLNLLDVGLSPVLGRQVAYSRANPQKFENFLHLLKSVELIFAGLSFLIILACVCFSKWISTHWINPQGLSLVSVNTSLWLMAAIACLKFFTTAYKSGINGFEDQKWINLTSVKIASIKYIGGILLVYFFTKRIEIFFLFQLLVAIVEGFVFHRRMYSNIPLSKKKISILKVDWRALSDIKGFAFGVSYTSLVLIALTQFDKLILSGNVSLEEYGYFSIVALVSGSMLTISAPVFLAFMPKMTMLATAGEKQKMVRLYVIVTQVVTAIVFPLAAEISMYPLEVMRILTAGRATSGDHMPSVLAWYTVGSAFFVLGTYQYYLQNALGSLRLYIQGSTVAAAVQLPLMFWICGKYGTVGAAYLWCAFSFFWFLSMTAIVHIRFLPGFNTKWLLRDIIPIILIGALAIYASRLAGLISSDEGILPLLLKLSIFGLLAMVASLMWIKNIRSFFGGYLKIGNFPQS